MIRVDRGSAFDLMARSVIAAVEAERQADFATEVRRLRAFVAKVASWPEGSTPPVSWHAEARALATPTSETEAGGNV